MNQIVYRNLVLNEIQSLVWQREPMFDPSNTTYECTRWSGSVIVSYNPGANSFAAGNPPVIQSGKFPAETDNAIRNYLEQPRGNLVVTSLGIDVVQTPEPGRVCDVRNGPYVRVNSIAQVQGERLWKIHLEFETYINEFPTERSNNNLPPIFVSNRWYCTDDINWQHLRTRMYQGVCTVRGDVLQQQDAESRYVDALRSQFAGFSVQDGFQRDRVHVTVNPDGNTAHYAIIDTEQLFSKSNNCPAIRLEVMETNWLWKGSLGRAVSQVGGWEGVTGRGITAATSLNVGWVFTELSNWGRAVQSNLPKAYKHVVVRCWGNQTTSRQALVVYAWNVANARMVQGGNPRPLIDTTTSETVISQDSNNFVQVSETINWGEDVNAGFFGPITGVPIIAAQQAFGANVFADVQEQFMRSVQGTPNFIANDANSVPITFTQTQRLNNPPFPAASGTRGSSALPSQSGYIARFPVVGAPVVPPIFTPARRPNLQTLLTQVLEGFNTPPASLDVTNNLSELQA